jgi:hypothetical protein
MDPTEELLDRLHLNQSKWTGCRAGLNLREYNSIGSGCVGPKSQTPFNKLL